MNSPVAWALVFHIAGFVFWMAGLLVATTLLALHAEEPSPDTRQTLKRLEMRFLRGFAHPGAAITVLAGAAVVALQPGYLHQFWLHAKLFLVAVLIGLDLVVYGRAKAFHRGSITLTRRECMVLHGAVSLVFLGIVILVLIKPF